MRLCLLNQTPARGSGEMSLGGKKSVSVAAVWSKSTHPTLDVMPAMGPEVFSAVKGGAAAAPRLKPLTALNTSGGLLARHSRLKRELQALFEVAGKSCLNRIHRAISGGSEDAVAVQMPDLKLPIDQWMDTILHDRKFTLFQDIGLEWNEPLKKELIARIARLGVTSAGLRFSRD